MKNMLITGILFFFCALTGKQPCDVLFYVQDAGETNGLLPVAKTLRNSGCNVQILAGGTAEGILKKDGSKYIPMSQMGAEINAKHERDQLLATQTITKILDSWEPKIFVSGVSFSLQGQLYKAFDKEGIETIAFWDNFNAEGEDSYFKTAHRVAPQAHLLWVPSEYLAKSEFFAGRESLFISGQPSLEHWIQEASKVKKEEIRNQFSIEKEIKLAVFVGGYGADYEASFELLLQSLDTLSPNDLYVLVMPHPKYGGSVETKILNKRTSNRAVPLKILQGNISTIEAVASADIVLCHQSTVGFQSLFLKKAVIHLIPAGQKFTSLPLEKGWAKKVNNPHTFKAALESSKKTEEDIAAVLGLPANSTSRCADHLLELLEAQFNLQIAQ